ncbi:MAG: hypothetical protein WCA27_11450 [Candidatus Sulfotelmatobacter sp.]
MTAEVKYYLDLDDVLAVRLECSACHVSSSFPLAKLTRAPHECPYCHADWVIPQTAEEKGITTFLQGLRAAIDALKGRPFKLSLEVNYEEPEPPI